MTTEKEPSTLLGLLRLVPRWKETSPGESLLVQQGPDYFIVEVSPSEYEELGRRIKEIVAYIESLGLTKTDWESL